MPAASDRASTSLNGLPREEGIGAPWIATTAASGEPVRRPDEQGARPGREDVHVSGMVWLHIRFDGHAGRLHGTYECARLDAGSARTTSRDHSDPNWKWLERKRRPRLRLPRSPPAADPAPAPARPVAPRESAPPPPSPAQAAKVLAREADPNEPVDLTGDSIVQGAADSVRGRLHERDGEQPNAVHRRPRRPAWPAARSGSASRQALAGPGSVAAGLVCQRGGRVERSFSAGSRCAAGRRCVRRASDRGPSRRNPVGS